MPIPVLAGIPKMPYIHRRHRLAPTSMPPFAFDQIGKLRAQMPKSNESSTIMVTGADAGDGKTTIAACLAAALTEGKQDVILLDLDLRRPGLADIFGLQSATHRPLQIESASLAQMLVPSPGVPSIRVCRHDEQVFRCSNTWSADCRDLLIEARGLAKWIVLDTPPVGEVGDALRFAPE